MADTARWIAVVAGKGGVGKTTTTINLAAALAEAGVSCLVVDCDPQSNLTAGLGHDPYQLAVTVADVITGRSTPAEAIVQTAWENLDVLPASPNLTTVEGEIASSLGKELRLRDALRRDNGVSQYRVVFFDTPPSFGFHTISAMAAAQYVLVPLQMSGFALRGLKEVIRAVGAAQTQLNPDLKLLGAVHTFVSRTRFSRELRGALSEVAPIRAFETTISQTVKLQETALIARPVTGYASKSKPAEEYRALAGELIAALQYGMDGHAHPEAADEDGTDEAEASPVETPVAAVATNGHPIGYDRHRSETGSVMGEAAEEQPEWTELEELAVFTPAAVESSGAEPLVAIADLRGVSDLRELALAGVVAESGRSAPARRRSPLRRLAGRIHRRHA